MVRLIEAEPGKWRVDRPVLKRKRSDLPLPYVISDIMDPTEQVDGKFYTSKREFRRVGKILGLIEVGNEKQKPLNKVETTASRNKRRESIRTAIEKYQAGHRVRTL